MGPSIIEMVIKGSEKVILQFWLVLMVQQIFLPFWRVPIDKEVENVPELLRVNWCSEPHIGFWWFISGQDKSFMYHQEDNYTPQPMIIHLNPLDSCGPLQSGTISHDAILPRISQEQQHHSKLPKDCFRSLNSHCNTTGTHQIPTAPFS